MAKKKKGKSKDNDQYINTSFFIMNEIDEDGEKEKYDFEEGETKEVTFSLTEEKAEQLLEKMQEAMEAQEGDGGLRISLYCKLAVFDDNEYETASILILPKTPSKKGKGKKSSFGKGGGGRKSYPAKKRSKRDEYEDDEDEDEDYEDEVDEDELEEEEEEEAPKGKRGGKAAGKKPQKARKAKRAVEEDDEEDDDDIPF